MNTSQSYRSYNETFENLWEEITNYYEDMQDNLGNNLDDISNVVGDVGNGMNSSFVDSMLNQGRDHQSILDNISV